MLDIYDELKSLVRRLDEGNIEYALCGGLAMAVHGVVRATEDIDILVPSDHLDKGLEIARNSGFDIPAVLMTFAGGKIRIHRVTKADQKSGDVLSLDILLVTDFIRHIWENRRNFPAEDGSRITAVSKEGLIQGNRIKFSKIT